MDSSSRSHQRVFVTERRSFVGGSDARIERNTGQTIKHVQRWIQHPIHKWMAATLDGLVDPGGAVFEAKFMLPWNFSEEGAAEKHMTQLQHNMWVTASRTAVLSIITGGGKWVEMTIPADPLYQHLLLTAERKFWRSVETGEPPQLLASNRRGPVLMQSEPSK
jgi:predicted phage-related endonuclease